MKAETLNSMLYSFYKAKLEIKNIYLRRVKISIYSLKYLIVDFCTGNIFYTIFETEFVKHKKARQSKICLPSEHEYITLSISSICLRNLILEMVH